MLTFSDLGMLKDVCTVSHDVLAETHFGQTRGPTRICENFLARSFQVVVNIRHFAKFISLERAKGRLYP